MLKCEDRDNESDSYRVVRSFLPDQLTQVQATESDAYNRLVNPFVVDPYSIFVVIVENNRHVSQYRRFTNDYIRSWEEYFYINSFLISLAVVTLAALTVVYWVYKRITKPIVEITKYKGNIE